MLSKKIINALNDQISMEGAAAHKYLAMACWCDEQGLEGSAKFFMQHSEEERMHMMKIVHYLLEADASPIIPTLEQPKLKYKDVQEVVEVAYDSEKKVTQSIHKLVALANKEGDPQTYNFLQWYVAEQLEEEALMRRLLDKMKLIGKGARSLYYIDLEMAQLEAEEAANDSEV